MFRHFMPEKVPCYARPLTWIAEKFLLTPEQGAATSIYLATSQKVATTSGKYFSDCKEINPTREARNQSIARRLWEESLQLTNMPDPLPTS